MYGITTTTAAASEPVTLAEAKAQCNIASSNTDHDTLLGTLITAGREYAERYLHRQLVTATLTTTCDTLPVADEPLYLPCSPLQSVTYVKYLDENATQQTLSSTVYRVTTNREPGFISIAANQSWPSTFCISDAIEVRFVAGYGAAAAVPQTIKRAILLMVNHWFQYRSDQEDSRLGEISFGVHSLLDSYRVADDFLWYAPAK